MQDIVGSIIDSIKKNGDLKASERMITQLGYILERSRLGQILPEHRQFLTDEQVNLVLTTEQQRLTVLRVLQIIQENEDNVIAPSLMWCIGKAHPRALVTPLQNYLLESAERMSDELIYQGIIALGSCFLDNDSEDYEYVVGALKFSHLEAMIQKLALSQNHELKYQAEQQLKIIDWYRQQSQFRSD